MEQQADLMAFDRINHMGISQQTVESIKSAITTEAAQASAPGGVSSAINIKENEDRVKQLKVGGVRSGHTDDGWDGSTVTVGLTDMWQCLGVSIFVVLETFFRSPPPPHCLQAFWMPSQGPSAKVVVSKPDTETYCPASGKKLKMKDLISVRA